MGVKFGGGEVDLFYFGEDLFWCYLVVLVWDFVDVLVDGCFGNFY